MAKKSQTKYRWVFESEFQPEWEAFVLECRKQGLTPDQLMQTLVSDFNRSKDSSADPATEGPPKASPLPTSGLVDKPKAPETKSRAPAKSSVRKKKKVTTRKRPERPGPTKPPSRSAARTKSRVSTTRKHRPRKGRPKPQATNEMPDLPTLGSENDLSSSSGPSLPGSLPPLPRETEDLPTTTAPRKPPPRPTNVMIPTHKSPKYQLLELMHQLDIERNGLEREDVLKQARTNSITNPELNLNKLIRRGLVHIYEGRCRTA